MSLYNFPVTHRMDDTESERQCKRWTPSDDDELLSITMQRMDHSGEDADTAVFFGGGCMRTSREYMEIHCAFPFERNQNCSRI